MKVLITGATAQQGSQRTAERVSTFASLVSQELTLSGSDVTFVEPSLEYTKEKLSEYDVVLVGIAPPTSLSANKIYPAFAIANRAKELGNLALFLDAPEPFKIQASLKSCYLNISDLQKDFYRNRKNYKEVVSTPELASEIYSFIEFLHKRPWPTTLFSAFPWSEASSITSVIPNIEEANLFGINLDHLLFKDSNNIPMSSQYKSFWTCDSPNTKWSRSIQLTLKNPVLPTRGSRWESALETDERIKASIGTLVSVHRSLEPWWTPFLARSLALGRPVVTDWRYSSALGEPWSHLASTVEEMSPSGRAELAKRQRASYLESVSQSNYKNVSLALESVASRLSFTYN
jgi:hypothetical protein